MEKQRILYGSIVSPFVRKVWVVLKLKNLSFELQELIPFFDKHKEKLLSLNPLGKVPVFQDDNLILNDSSVICAYLEKKYSQNAIFPLNLESYGQCLWYEKYADSVFTPATTSIFFDKVLAKRFERPPNMLSAESALNVLPKIFDYLEGQIGKKRYLVGDRISLADIALSVPFLNLEFTGYTLDKKWSSLDSYLHKIRQEKIIHEAEVVARERLVKAQSS